MSVTDQAGPFVVSRPNVSGLTWTAGSVQKVRWDVANTDLPPVDAAEVDILLSTDGGFTYPHLLRSATPNDGEAEVVVPNLPGNACRIMVRAADNFFFDISDENFAIEAAISPDFSLYGPADASALCAGETLRVPLLVQPSGGFSQAVNLVVGGLPAGVSAVPTPSVVSPGDTAFIELTAATTAAAFQGAFQVLGSVSGGPSDFRSFPLEIAAAEGEAPRLLAPLVGARGLSRKPVLRWSEVPGAASYRLEVAANPSFTSNALTVEDLRRATYQLAAQLAEASPYYWRVTALDACGDELRSQVGAFQTGACQRALPGNLPQDIPSLGAPHTLTSSAVMGLNAPVVDVNVLSLRGEHASVRDLRAVLRSPAGTEVTLMDRICGSDDRNFRLSFDDESDLTEASCPPSQGETVQPEEDLSAFDGENSLGSWDLILSDLAEFDGGTWYGWELEVCAALNDAPQLVTNRPLTVLAGFPGYIDSSYLKAVAPNFGSQDLFFTLVEGPRHGELRRGPVTLGPGSIFVQEKVDQGQLIYLHDGSSAATDSFVVAVENPNQGWTGLYTFHLTIVGVPQSLRSTPALPELALFPVPARDRLTLRWSAPLSASTELSLLDLQGREVKQHILPAGAQTYRWNLRGLSAGLYLLQVKQGGISVSYKVSLKD
jgi:subtilisin-like proprotein convertase family protein